MFLRIIKILLKFIYITGKLHLIFDFPFYIQRRGDGEIYIKCNFGSIKYDYTIGGPVLFAADNLYLGDQESSKYKKTLNPEKF